MLSQFVPHKEILHCAHPPELDFRAHAISCEILDFQDYFDV